MYKCHFCSFHVFTVRDYLQHYRLHCNIRNIIFPCCFDNCTRNFVKFTSLKCHLSRDHSHSAHRNIQFNDNSFVCYVDSCKISFNNLRNLVSHCKHHVSSHQPIPCPYLECEGVFTKHSSFTSHISRKHKLSSTDSTGYYKALFLSNTSNDSSLESDGQVAPSNLISIEVEDSFSDLVDYKGLLDSLAVHFMKLEAVHLIPVSTINSMMSDVTDLHRLSVDLMLKRINRDIQFDTPEHHSKIEQIMHTDHLKAILHGDHAVLDTDFKRKRFYRQRFRYVEPIELYLGLDENNKRCVYHYIPLKNVLWFMLKDSSVVNQISKPLDCDEDTYTDITDGKSLKSNTYFQRNTDALKLILYQDAFEIVNPLGSAKKTFKLIGFYFTMVDIYPHNRSKIDPLQMTILCREKDFQYFDNGRVIIERLVKEIKEISCGVTVDNMVIKANIVCILGDNLGSHFIGGFCTNFSSGQYYCRYCLMTKYAYETCPLGIRNAELRTIENFNNSVKHLEENNEQNHVGIKSDSLLNGLQGFHVCNPALPPCLGHDLFEGVVKYDLALCLSHLIKVKKWFDLKTLNYYILSFGYLGNDLSNKPVPLKAKCDNIGGHAVQIWTFLRLLPIIIKEHVKNQEDEVWKCVLMLRLITEYICSPKISVNQVGILHQLLDDYIVLRKELFPSVNLRPKHHYVHHYPYLITQFGPLIRVWTMRFESKHTYFKRCIRSSKNFKNVTKTLSEKHQLLQSYYSVGNLFPSNVPNVVDEDKVSPKTVGMEMYGIINAKIKDLSDVTYSKTVTINGYIIKSGNCILIDNNNECMGFGKVEFFLINNSAIELVCRYICSRRSAFGLYNVDFRKGDIILIDPKNVLDLCPLYLYKNVIALKHYPFSKWH